MYRRLIVWTFLLALGLQVSGSVFAAVIPQPDCQMAAEHHSESPHKPCCPTGTHTVSCCLDIGLAVIPMAPSSSALSPGSSLVPPWRTTSFSSRGDSPLIRPPIL
jgi:hypothetical protein